MQDDFSSRDCCTTLCLQVTILYIHLNAGHLKFVKGQIYVKCYCNKRKREKETERDRQIDA